MLIGLVRPNKKLSWWWWQESHWSYHGDGGRARGVIRSEGKESLETESLDGKESLETESYDEKEKQEEDSDDQSSPRGVLEIPISGSDSDNSSCGTSATCIGEI
ncbi:hypothetical protein LOK49_LG04G01560 [Camellia lanceoleosa]|uniref:Uncharacterized protein n=1 Tax=Camellia lanceoleosa TaxID=1840588 RepID=A0ACC0I2A4_9ERIC|nr:hypothetical protein LOK49_LG04G01560 [Camellia lanceoleosa]